MEEDEEEGKKNEIIFEEFCIFMWNLSSIYCHCVYLIFIFLFEYEMGLLFLYFKRREQQK